MKHLRTALIVLILAFSVGIQAQAGKHSKHKFSASQAQSIALKKYPGKVVGKVALENEEGKWQYAVMIRSGQKLREVMVGADNGKIENVEVTTAKKEAKEAAADKNKSKSKTKKKVVSDKRQGEREDDEKSEKGEREEGGGHEFRPFGGRFAADGPGSWTFSITRLLYS